MPGLSQSGPDWSLKKNKNDILVYTRPVKGIAYDAIRAEMQVEGRVASALAIIWDVDRYPEWLPHTSEVEVLETAGQSSMVYYLQTSVPWPASDRDGIYEIRISEHGDTAIVAFTCLPDRIPKRESYVRIPSCDGKWTFKPMPDGKLKVTYEMRSALGGSVPGWMANMSSASMPYRMLSSLKDRLGWEEYRNADFPSH